MQCPVCGKPFTPKQRNSTCCSAKCSQVRRSRKYLDSHPEQVKKNNTETEKLLTTRYYRMVYASRKQKTECTILFEDYVAIISGPCYWCGGLIAENSYGIDRLHSDIGYVLGNVVPCCSTCNYGKRTQTPEEFKAWIRRVHFHLFGEKV